jgi:dienelactone hydrolase
MTSVRAIFQAARVEAAQPPYDTLHLKVFYPAQPGDSEQERDLGLVPAAADQAPFPVVIFFNGINCGPELYQWLAVALAERGLVVVTFAWVAENLPGLVALTPGVDLAAMMPQGYGSGPTASALPSLLTALERLQAEGILAGLLDLDQIILGGHSAGGRVAIESADSRYCPQLAGAFAYAAHTAAAVQMGFPANTILPLPDRLPLLLIGGTRDGVIAQSSYRYGVTWERAETPVVRTFQEALQGGRGDSYLAILEGANHFAIAHPFDGTTGRPALDFPPTQPSDHLRRLISDLIGLFIEAEVRRQPEAAAALQQLATAAKPLIAGFYQK